MPRFGIGQTYKPNIHLTENERQLLENFQPELVYGKVRVRETRKFIPDMVLYDKKVFETDRLLKIERFFFKSRSFDSMVILLKQFVKVRLNIIASDG